MCNVCNVQSAKLPVCPSMSAACCSASVICQTVAFQDIGYKGEIGYQTFLYSNEPEIRALLMCLVEKLPRESAETSDQPTGTDTTSLSAIHIVLYCLFSEKGRKYYIHCTIFLHLFFLFALICITEIKHCFVKSNYKQTQRFLGKHQTIILKTS